jgi:hypothetical protein
MTEIIETNESVEATQLLTRTEVKALVAAANAEVVDPIRAVSQLNVDRVIERTYLSTDGLNKSSRNFAIRKAVGRYIDLVTKGLVASAAENHTDLLRPAHPYSTTPTVYDEATLRTERAKWVAAEPGIKEDYRAIIASALSQPEGSMEALHGEMRLLSLTASGELPTHLVNYGHAITASVAPDVHYDDIRQENFESTRAAALALVSHQTAMTASGELPYDIDGSLPRRIYRGDSKKSILAHLERSASFNQAVENLNADMTAADPFAIYARDQFEVFFNTLSDLDDAPQLVDLREVASGSIAKYDTTGEIAKAILAGAGSDYVLAKLGASKEWTADFKKYSSLTASGVSESSNADLESFTAIYEAVLDIDGEADNYVSLREVLPSK